NNVYDMNGYGNNVINRQRGAASNNYGQSGLRNRLNFGANNTCNLAGNLAGNLNANLNASTSDVGAGNISSNLIKNLGESVNARLYGGNNTNIGRFNGNTILNGGGGLNRNTNGTG